MEIVGGREGRAIEENYEVLVCTIVLVTLAYVLH
jgi:hypothetical protein